MRRRFTQVDVFGVAAFRGNPLAVVVDGDGVSDDEMQQFANWTNLSETTFIVPPTRPDADYRVRIFTAATELPFAGHPTLGTCHAWLDAGGVPREPDEIVQECGVGLVRVRPADGRLAFAAPPLIRSGPAEPEVISEAAEQLGLHSDDIVACEWVDNGPGWLGVLLESAEAVLATRPRPTGRLKLGMIGAHEPGAHEPGGPGGLVDFEVRALFPSPDGVVFEDPVTGSLNASLAQWLLGTGQASSPYVARQGTVLGRDGRIYIEQIGDDIWVAGNAVSCITGHVDI